MSIWKTAVIGGAIQASEEVVTLYITILCVMTLWTEVLEIGHRPGLMDQLVGRMGPMFTFLFLRLDPDGKARKQISVNMTTNTLGLGWAATPTRLKAMEELKKVEEEHRKGGAVRQKDTPGQEGTAGQRAAARQTGIASNEMRTFLIISIFSLQLIPMNMIVYRSQYGSVDPTTITGSALATAFISTVVVMILCKVMDRQMRAVRRSITRETLYRMQQMRGDCGSGSMRKHILQPDLITYNVVRILNCHNYFLCFC